MIIISASVAYPNKWSNMNTNPFLSPWKVSPGCSPLLFGVIAMRAGGVRGAHVPALWGSPHFGDEPRGAKHRHACQTSPYCLVHRMGSFHPLKGDEEVKIRIRIPAGAQGSLKKGEDSLQQISYTFEVAYIEK